MSICKFLKLFYHGDYVSVSIGFRGERIFLRFDSRLELQGPHDVHQVNDSTLLMTLENRPVSKLLSTLSQQLIGF